MKTLVELESLPDLLRTSSAKFGGEPALQWAGRPESVWSYATLRDYACRGGSFLEQASPHPGAPVVLLLESGPEWAAAFFAVLQAGCVVVPLTPETPPERVGAIAQKMGSPLVIVSDRTKPLVASIQGLDLVPVRCLLEHPESLNSHRVRSAEDPAVLAFTSGTTMRPKAVVLSHTNLLSDVRSVLRVRSGGPGEAMLSLLPLAHLFEMTGGLLAPLACGARVVYTGSPLPNRILASMRDEGITHALIVPALVECLLDEIWSELAAAGVLERGNRGESLTDWAARSGSFAGRTDLEAVRESVRSLIGPSLHTLIVGGAALRPEIPDILELFGIRTEVGYGLTEAGPIVSLDAADQCPRGSVGRPLPGVEVRIAADGEIQVRGGNVMTGYHGDPEATASVLVDGWLKTGDRGCLDDQGYLFVTGRFKDVIVTGTGETVDAREMEACYRHPLYSEVCVGAVRGPDGNDLPVLFVVTVNPNTSEEDCRQAFRGLRAAAPARLRAVRVVCLDHPLPRTHTGKIRRAELSQTYSEREGVVS